MKKPEPSPTTRWLPCGICGVLGMPNGANGLNGRMLPPPLPFMLTGCSSCTFTDTTAGRTLAIRSAKPLDGLALAVTAGAAVAALRRRR